MVRDVRFAIRLLVLRPSWALASILCLAIATGANTAAFSVVNALILRPLPFRDAQQIVVVALKEPERAETRPFSLDEYRELSARAGGSIALVARTFLPVSVVGDDGARMAEAEFVSANYFETLGIAPFAGALRRAEPDRSAAEPAIVIGHALWKRRFGGNPAFVGRTIRINGQPFTVSAIAPDGFVGAMRLIAADLWIPTALYSTLARAHDAERVPLFGVMGRMTAGVTEDRVRAELDAQGSVIRGSALIFGLMACSSPSPRQT